MGMLLVRLKDVQQDASITLINDDINSLNANAAMKADNLAGLADYATARENLNVYSKGSVDTAISNAINTVESGIKWMKAAYSVQDDAPDSPAEGDRYIVSANPTANGTFDGHANEIAEYNGSEWEFTAPTDGTSLILTKLDGNPTYRFSGEDNVWSEIHAHIALATQDADGLLSAADKTRLDNIIGNYAMFQEPDLLDVVDDGNGGYKFTVTNTPLSGALVGKVIVFDSNGNVKAEFAKMVADANNDVAMPSSYTHDDGDKAYAEYIQSIPV